MARFKKDLQYYKFGFYGFLKNLRLFEPFLILFFLESGLTYLQIGVLYSFREIAHNIIEIPSGVLADAFGRRRYMIISFSAYVSSFIVFYFANSYSLFVVAMLFYALGDAFRTGTHKAMIIVYLKTKGWEDQKVDYYGHTRSFSQFGSAISSILAAALVFYSGSYRVIFVITVIPYFLDLLLLVSYPKSLDEPIANISSDRIITRFKLVFIELYNSFKNVYILKLILSVSWYSGYYKVVKDFVQPMIVALAVGLPILLSFSGKQKSALMIGIVYFIIYVLSSLASKNTHRINNIFSSEIHSLNLLMLLGIIAGVTASIAYIYGQMVLAIFAMVPVFLIENIRKPLGVSVIADNIDKDIMASALSVQSQIQTLAVIFAAPILGFFSDKYGLGQGLFYTSLIFMFGSLLLRIKDIKEKK